MKLKDFIAVLYQKLLEIRQINWGARLLSIYKNVSAALSPRKIDLYHFKWRMVLLGIFYFAFCSNASAQNFYGSTDLSGKSLEDVSVSGSTTMENTNCKNLLVKGTLNYKKATIQEKLVVQGLADGEGLQANHIIIKGSLKGSKINAAIADIDGSVIVVEANIAKIIRVTGYLRAQDSEFNDIILESTYSALENSKAGNILVKQDGKRLKKLILKDGSIINGDIKFESGEGEIHLFDQSKILGKVIGAEIVKK